MLIVWINKCRPPDRLNDIKIFLPLNFVSRVKISIDAKLMLESLKYINSLSTNSFRPPAAGHRGGGPAKRVKSSMRHNFFSDAPKSSAVSKKLSDGEVSNVSKLCTAFRFLKLETRSAVTASHCPSDGPKWNGTRGFVNPRRCGRSGCALATFSTCSMCSIRIL